MKDEFPTKAAEDACKVIVNALNWLAMRKGMDGPWADQLDDAYEQFTPEVRETLVLALQAWQPGVSDERSKM